MPAYGADVLRWWVAESNVFSEVQIGPTALSSARDGVNKVLAQQAGGTSDWRPVLCSQHSHAVCFLSQVRNTLKFLLGNLQGFDPRVQAVDPKDMHYIDQYMLHLLREYSMKVRAEGVLSDCVP